VPNGEDWRIQKLEESVDRHERDIYRGNGKPGLTARVEKVEDAITAVKFYGRWIILLVGGMLIKEIILLTMVKK
jgi:hypothetical protein